MQPADAVRAAAIRRALLAWYRRHGRTALPWRQTRDPYYTLVSEFMLQQTQVDRVAERFAAFVARFPDFIALARATVGDVLREWKGLGYNARAVRLREVARAVCQRDDGSLPAQADALLALPGIGPYTAAAIRAFAFDLDDAPVDTNVRRILQRAFYGSEPVKPAELAAFARSIVPHGRAHDWSSALMDLGASICTSRAPKCLVCPLARHCAAAPFDPQSPASRRPRRGGERSVPFERTDRYARGRIVDRLRELAPGKRISLLDLYGDLAGTLDGRTPEDVARLVVALEREGVLSGDASGVALPD